MTTSTARWALGGLIGGILLASVSLAIAQENAEDPSSPADQSTATGGASTPPIINGQPLSAEPVSDGVIHIGQSTSPLPKPVIDKCQASVAGNVDPDAGSAPTEEEVALCKALIAQSEGVEVPPGDYSTNGLEALLSEASSAGEQR